MTSFTGKKTVFALCVLALFSAFELSAQFSSFVNGKLQRRDRTKPTTVKSESMDIDIQNERVTLIGNVDVDDPEMNIKCRKMIIHLADAAKKPKDTASPGDGDAGNAGINSPGTRDKADKADKVDKAASGEAGKKKEKEPGDGTNKQVTMIECIGDVVITRPAAPGTEAGGGHRAYAGEAVYYITEDRIVLKDNPVVYSGRNKLKGEIITLYPKTERVLVLKPDSEVVGGIGGQLSDEKK